MAQITYDFEKPIIDIEEELALLESNAMVTGTDLSAEISKLKEKRDNLIIDIHSKLSRWQKVQLARHPDSHIPLIILK